MEEEAPLRFYGCGVNSFLQLGPLLTDAQAGAAAAAEEKEDATIPPQDQHPPHHPQARGGALHLPQPLAFDRFLAEEDGPVKDLACGSTFTVALTTRGVPYQWGTLNGTLRVGKRGQGTKRERREDGGKRECALM
jgi:alpha-tubulin suppressor-like RCC1 family protein